MLNLKDGILEVTGKKTKIKPKYTTSDFALSDLYKEVLSEDKDSYSNYYLRPQVIEGEKFVIRIYFNPQNVIYLVNLSFTDSTNWEEWSEKEQINKKLEHDKWLEGIIGKPPYKFLWGEISSNYDSRSGSSMITIRYY